MKMRKLAAFLAAGVAVTSLSLGAFADAAPETEDVSSNSQFMLKLQSTKADGSGNNYDGAYAGGNAVKTLTLDGSKIQAETGTDSDGLTFAYAVGPVDDTYEIDDVLTVSVTGLTIKAVKSSVEETLVDNEDKTWTQTKNDGWWAGDQSLTLSSTSFTDIADFKANGSIVATWTALTVTVPKPAETSSSSSSSSSSAPVDPPAGDKTLTFTSNSWVQGNETKYNAQGEVVVKSGTVAEIKALDNYTEELTVKTVTNGTIGDIQCVAVLSGDGVKNGYAARYEEGSQAYNISLNSAFTIQFNKAWVAENLLETGNVQMKAIFSTKTSGSEAFTEFPVLTYTNKQQGSGSGEGEGSGSGSSTAAPAEPNVPNIRPVAPSGASTEAAATTTAAPEVVTAANGEAVEAAKDVIPAGATLEVKEQPKEEAVKAVEAIKATDENKEVVETVKKAVEAEKAAVVDIDLVKDGAKVQPNGTIKVTINVPAALKDAANLFVYRVEEDGKLTDVKASVVNGKLVFSTSHFSTYIITSEALSGDAVVTEAAATTAAPTAPEKPDDKNQATGVVIAVIPAVIAAAGVIISKKRK